MMPNWMSLLSVNVAMRTTIAYDDPGIASVFRSELRPDACELVVGGTTLANDITIPTSIVVLGWLSVSEVYQNTYWLTKSTMTWTLDPELRADWTVASYSWKKDELMVPPSVGVMSCHAKLGFNHHSRCTAINHTESCRVSVLHK